MIIWQYDKCQAFLLGKVIFEQFHIKVSLSTRTAYTFYIKYCHSFTYVYRETCIFYIITTFQQEKSSHHQSKGYSFQFVRLMSKKILFFVKVKALLMDTKKKRKKDEYSSTSFIILHTHDIIIICLAE